MYTSLLLLLLALPLRGAEDVVVLWGKPVAASEAGAVVDTFCEAYATHFQLKPTAEDLAPVRRKIPQPERGIVDFGYLAVRNWKLNRHWWARHGGRLVLSAFGAHLATDAMLAEMSRLERSGEIRWLDEGARRKFRQHWLDYRGDGVVSGARVGELLKQYPGN